MGKLIMWNLITLDGFFEGDQNWDMAFLQSAMDDDLERLAIEQLDSTDCLLFGRVTYEGMAAYWKTASGTIADYMNRLPKIVASRTLETPDWHNTTLVKENLAETVQRLKRQDEKDIYVYGSAVLSETLMQDDLFDEYRIAIVPVFLGSGRTLFGNVRPHSLKLLESKTFPSGCVMLRYANAPVG